MARDNYSYKKFQKELANKKKAEEKKQRKLEKEKAEIKLEPDQVSNEDTSTVI
ncbi:MAG: hypothetical protein PHU59_04085 [Candidatus Omnitrophica bacterium]|nr:hypothetical protein [Candidatus Omnitrophota bacterium]